MVKVRLARAGNKKRPFYHIVVTDSESPRDGKFIARLGTYDPSRPIEEARVDHEKLGTWIANGAQASERVAKVAKAHKKWLDAKAAETAGAGA